MAIQHDLETLLTRFDEAAFVDAMTAVPGALFGVAIGMAREEWSAAFPEPERIDDGDGWYVVGSESYPDDEGVGFEVAFETAGADDDRGAPGDVTQVSIKLRFRVATGAEGPAEALRSRLLDRIASHFRARLRRGRSLGLPGGPLVATGVHGWEQVYASVDVTWAAPDGVETTLMS